MKLFYIANARMPTERAHGWQIVKMCEALSRAGVDVELVVPRRWGNPLKENPFEFYKLKPIFKIKYLPCLDLLSFVKGDLASILAFKLQATTFALAVFLNYIWRKGLFFSRDHFSALFLSLAGRKVYLEIHDQPSGTLPMQILLRKLEGLVTTNAWKGKEVSRVFKLPTSKIFVSGNAVDTGEFLLGISKNDCRRMLALDGGERLVVYAGHFYAWKGVFTLVQAVNFLPDDVKVVFVGGNKNSIEQLKQFASQEKLPANKIEIVGYKPHGEIPSYLCAADALVVPTSAKERIGYFETSPLKLMECMAARRPLVVADTPSAREIVGENEVTFFEPDNPKDLADKLMGVLNSQANHEEKIKNAWRKVLGMSWDNRARSILEFING